MRPIIFDWDGTLVDTMPAIQRANVQVLHEHGIDFDDDRYREVYAPDWRLMYRRLGIPDAEIEAAGARWLEVYEANDVVRPFEGIERSLAALADAGHELAIVTAGHRRVVERQLARFGLSGLLPVRVCGDDGELRQKPHPEPLLRALDELGAADPTTATYVGDAADDMRMARAVGARGIGIVSLLSRREELEAAGAEIVHASVRDWVEEFLASPERAVGAR
jgi:HAD superfamily hydrolase (TIGR01549 family)